MRLVRIYITGDERITVYKEGGCQFERNLGPGMGWIVDNDACCNWYAAIAEAQRILARVTENLEIAG